MAAIVADVVFLTSAVAAVTVATARGASVGLVWVCAAVAVVAAIGVWRTRRDARLAQHDAWADARWVAWVRVGLRGAVVAALGGVLAMQERPPRTPGFAMVAWEPPDWGDAGPRCPEGMVLVPTGSFMMGSPEGVGARNEHPQHRVTIAAFCIDRTEVTVAEYRACVRAGECTEPGREWSRCNWGVDRREDHPVNCIDWHQAQRYCAWSDNPRGAGRLPREAEWEYAARGSDGRTYPWGEESPDDTRLWWSATTPRGGTTQAGQLPRGASPFGALDMAGNVWEWVDDVYVSDAYAQHSPEGHRRARDASLSTELRVLRGGSWRDNNASVARAANRYWNDPSIRYSFVGVRCARGVR